MAKKTAQGAPHGGGQGGQTPLTRDVLAAALALDQTGNLKLLTLVSALLGWVLALGVAGAVLLSHVYADWRLGRQNSLSIYLPAEAEAPKLIELENKLRGVPGILSVQLLPPAQVQALVAPYVADAASLPLPLVVEVETDPATPPSPILPVVQEFFPTAEADDPRPLLAAVASGVRALQTLGLVVGGLTVAILAILVGIVVHLALAAQRSVLQVLGHMGAPDARLVLAVARVVAWRTGTGWLLAAGGAAGLVALSSAGWPVLHPYVAAWPVWAAVVVAPLILPLLATLVAALATLRVVRRA